MYVMIHTFCRIDSGKCNRVADNTFWTTGSLLPVMAIKPRLQLIRGVMYSSTLLLSINTKKQIQIQIQSQIQIQTHKYNYVKSQLQQIRRVIYSSTDSTPCKLSYL